MELKLTRLFVFPATALMLSCLSGRPVAASGEPSPEGRALGTFSITSQTFGNLTLTPAACASGGLQFFLGGDLSAPDTPVVLRLVVDPLDGPAVRLYSFEAPFDKTVVFRRSDCAVFHFSLDDTGWRVNDVHDYRLTLQVECARDGESLRGSASSTHCH